MSNHNHVSKEFKTIEQQIELLKNRHLIINNEEIAHKHLLQKNYFDLINGFETLLLVDSKANNKSYDKKYFEDFLLLYNFDKQLNFLIMHLIDKFELRLKTSMAYRFCEKHFNTITDADCYIKQNNYNIRNNIVVSLPSNEIKQIGWHDLFKTNYKYNGISNLNYIDYCKLKYEYINSYQTPPFWVIIKTMTLGKVSKLLLFYKINIFENVLKDFNYNISNKQAFINSLDILIELRNSSAHFQLVNRFRTSNQLRIDNLLITQLNLETRLNTNGQHVNYEIKLYDTLKVLSQFEDIKPIKKLIQEYYFKKCNSKRQKKIFVNLLERMGSRQIKKWEKF